jgi:DivIVA domain-containing protein
VTYFLVLLAVLVAGAVAVYVLGLNRPRTGRSAELLADGFTDPVANLPAVLLPEEPAAADVDALRFSLGLRGYRMDQVDEVLDRLRDTVAAQSSRIRELEAALAAAAVGRQGGTP